MSPRAGAASAAEIFRRWWPVLLAVGLGLIGYGSLRQRTADAETAVTRIDRRVDSDEAAQATTNESTNRRLGDMEKYLVALVCKQLPEKCPLDHAP